MADHSLESLLQINKDGIKTKYQLEWELTEKFCRKEHSIPKWYSICDHDHINYSFIFFYVKEKKPTNDIES